MSSSDVQPKAARVRDPAAVKHAVLDAALELFARRGFAQTSLRDISRESGVSHPLILHHFGTKEALYQAVKRRVVEGYALRYPETTTELEQPLDLRAEMQRILTYASENELALKLCARTRVDDDFEVWPGEPDLFQLVSRRIAASQQIHTMRGDLNPELLSVMVIGIVLFWLENRRYFVQHMAQADDETYLDTAVRMIETGVLPK